MTCSSVFITGTDTGVGKTIVAATLAHILRSRGRNVGVAKPFATGCDVRSGTLVSGDALLLAEAAGVGDPHELICPVRFREPLAPMIAAEIERRPVDLDAARNALRRLAALHDALIVEGIGGIMVPLTARITVADFAAELAAPLVIVARAGLGTINHTLLTVEHARAKGLHIAGIVLNTPTPDAPGLAERTNRDAIARLSGLPVIGPLSHRSGFSTADLPAASAEFLASDAAAPLIAALAGGACG